MPAVFTAIEPPPRSPHSRKRMVLCLRSGGTLSGFTQLEALGSGGCLPVLLPDGQTEVIAPGELVAAYSVAGFFDPGALLHPPPRGAVPLPGVRVRCRTIDHQTREGLLASDLLRLSEGLEMTAPYAECPWQRVFIPHRAIEQLTIVEVVRAARRRRSRSDDQYALFSAFAPGGRD